MFDKIVDDSANGASSKCLRTRSGPLFSLSLSLLLILLIMIISAGLFSQNANAAIVAQSSGTINMLSSSGTVSSSLSEGDSISVYFRDPYVESTSSSGGGGGGGGSSTTVDPSYSQTFVGGLEANKSYKVVIDDEAIFIREIIFSLREKVSQSVDLKVIAFNNPLISLGATPLLNSYDPSLKGIYYGSISYAGLGTEEFSEAKIKFEVKKELLSSLNIDESTIKLYRFHNGAWTPLKTRSLGDTTTRLFFEAETPGFSFFAVGGKVINNEKSSEGSGEESSSGSPNGEVLTGGAVVKAEDEKEGEKNGGNRTEEESDQSSLSSTFYRYRSIAVSLIVVLLLGVALVGYAYMSSDNPPGSSSSILSGLSLGGSSGREGPAPSLSSPSSLSSSASPSQSSSAPFGKPQISDSLFEKVLSPEEQLRNYIEEELRDGFTRDEIMAELLKAGWDPVVAERALDSFSDDHMSAKGVGVAHSSPAGSSNDALSSLENFIKDKLVKGYSPRVIKDNLLRVGWNEFLINGVINDVKKGLSGSKVASPSASAEARIDEFVRASLLKGSSLEDIESRLLGVGWQKSIVDRILEKYREYE